MPSSTEREPFGDKTQAVLARAAQAYGTEIELNARVDRVLTHVLNDAVADYLGCSGDSELDDVLTRARASGV